MNQDKFKSVSLRNETVREKCPETEFFLVYIFPYLDTFHAAQCSKIKKNQENVERIFSVQIECQEFTGQ